MIITCLIYVLLNGSTPAYEWARGNVVTMHERTAIINFSDWIRRHKPDITSAAAHVPVNVERHKCVGQPGQTVTNNGPKLHDSIYGDY